jgi:hypothetical protein
LLGHTSTSQSGEIFRIDVGRFKDRVPGQDLVEAVEYFHGRKLLAGGLVRVHFEDKAHLLEVVLATGAPGGLARTGECGKQDGGQNADDGDDDE